MILDTNALSALAARDEALIEVIREAPRLAVTLISIGEYEFGLRQSRQKSALEKWLQAFLARADLLLPDRETVPFYAEIRSQLKAAGTPIPANDCWIAALARQHKMPVVSRDHHCDLVKGVRRVGW